MRLVLRAPRFSVGIRGLGFRDTRTSGQPIANYSVLFGVVLGGVSAASGSSRVVEAHGF